MLAVSVICCHDPSETSASASENAKRDSTPLSSSGSAIKNSSGPADQRTGAAASASHSSDLDASTPDAAADDGLPDADTRGCPDGMVRVEGKYCPDVAQHCLKYHPDFLARRGDPTVSDRCLVYQEPVRCIYPKRWNMAFCMDRFEYPNVRGELPRVLTSWREATDMCKQQGKRLCTEHEFNFACEGPDLLPYATGFEREETKCNIDLAYRQPNHELFLLPYDQCLKNEECRAELTRLDQRKRIGESLTCVSWAGVLDLNGNVNEWVRVRGERKPRRSGLKGGWWGPVRNRCRPTVKFHNEFDYGYEAGFRCCKDVDDGDAAAAEVARKREAQETWRRKRAKAAQEDLQAEREQEAEAEAGAAIDAGTTGTEPATTGSDAAADARAGKPTAPTDAGSKPTAPTDADGKPTAPADAGSKPTAPADADSKPADAGIKPADAGIKPSNAGPKPGAGGDAL